MGYGAAILAIVVLGICIRLAFAPIDLDFLRTYVAQTIDTPGGRMTIGADHIRAEWGGIARPMQLVFIDVHVTNENSQTVATAPNVALSFEPRSVLKARFLPTAIVVEHPTLDADITREGGMLQRVLAKSDASSQAEVVSLLIEQLMARPNYDTLLGQLDTVLVEHARVTMRDVPSGVVWVAPDVRARLKRDERGIIISANGRFDNGGGPVNVALSGTYARDRSRISLEAGIDGLKPSMLADLSPEAALLRGIDVALSGRMHIEADGNGNVQNVTTEVTGGAGTVTLPGILPVSHQVRSVNAAASIDAASHTAKIDHVAIEVGAAKISVTGTGERTEQGQTFSGRVEMRGIPIDRLGDYWPIDLAAGGRQWALANLSHGVLDVAADVGLSTPGDDLSQLKVDRIVAFLDYRDMQVHYMPHMPAIEGVTGKARYENDTLHFDIAHGAGVGLAIDGTTIDLTDLDSSSPQMARLHVPITGSAAAAITLLARRQLGLPKDVLYDPKRVGGDVSIALALSFPLLNALTVADLDIRADAALSRFSLKEAIGDIDLTESTGRILYEKSKLDVTGTGKLDGSPVDIVWRQQFGPKVTYRQRYELKGTIPAAAVAKAGFLSLEPYVTGPVGITNLAYQVAPNGTGELRGRFDLKDTQVAIAQLGWTKEAGADGRLALGLKLLPGGKPGSAEFDGRTADLSVRGTVRFGDENTVQQVTLSELDLGRTSTSVDWRRRPGGVDVDVRGKSIELAKVRQVLKERDQAAKATPGGAAQTSQSNTRVSVHLDQVLLQRGALGALNGQFEMSGDRIVSAELGLGAGRGTTFRVQPAPGARTVALYTADFGQLLRDAGWLDGLVSGYLDFRGRFDDGVAGAPLSGTLKLGPYHLQKVAPRNGIDSLNSTIDGLNRAGNALQQFDGLEADLVKAGDWIEVKNGHTSGRSIGLTTAGYLDLANDTARLRGVVVPAFALNNLLSNVPLLGPLLTGGKGAGVFAISYRLEGPFGDLKPDINMMSAVTPGALRELFNGQAAAPPAPAPPARPSQP
ncbi:MAG: hypothetical protein JSR91_26595 [Proteobacteria bacterium]|nr:hypothetical protein [Pseudomonadota bacterium]